MPLDTSETGLADDTGESPEPDCSPAGTFECPILIESFPFVDARNTAEALSDAADTYSCAPDTNESGPEWVYAVDVEEAGLLSVRLLAGNEGGVDIDVHVLEGPSADECVARDHIQTSWLVEPGRWYITADTWVDGSGVEQAGAFEMEVGFTALGTGRCAMEETELRMFWSACAPGIDCTERNGDVLLRLPSVGPVVKEAHLVTVEEFDGSWPTSFTDGIDAHYALSEAASGFSAARTEPWAPSGEGGSQYGQGSTGAPVPAEDEAWYVNMYWRDRPAKGTRMLVLNPQTGAAVVASGGYETGPGSNEAIGGAVEEIHLALGTGHRDALMMGFLVDQTLPLGPIDCSR